MIFKGKKKTVAYLLILSLLLSMIPTRVGYAEPAQPAQNVELQQDGEQVSADESQQGEEQALDSNPVQNADQQQADAVKQAGEYVFNDGGAPLSLITPEMYEYNDETGVYEYTIGFWQFEEGGGTTPTVRFDSIVVPSDDVHEYHLSIIGVDVYTDSITADSGSRVRILNRRNDATGEITGVGCINYNHFWFKDGSKLELDCNKNVPRFFNSDERAYKPIDIYDFFEDSSEPVNIKDDPFWGGITFAFDSAFNGFIVCSYGEDDGPQSNSITKEMYQYNKDTDAFELTIDYWDYGEEVCFDSIIVPSDREHEYHLSIIGVRVYTESLTINSGSTLHIWNEKETYKNELYNNSSIHYKRGRFEDGSKIELQCYLNTLRPCLSDYRQYKLMNIYEEAEGYDEPISLLYNSSWSGYTFAYDSANGRFVVCSYGDGSWYPNTVHNPRNPDNPLNPQYEERQLFRRLSDELAKEEFAFSEYRAKEEITVDVISDMVNGGRYQRLGEILGFDPNKKYTSEEIKEYSNCVFIEEEYENEWAYPGGLGDGTVRLRKHRFKFDLANIAYKNKVYNHTLFSNLSFTSQVYYLPTEWMDGDTNSREMNYAKIDSYVVVRVGIYAEGSGYIYYLRNCAQESKDFESLELAEGENNSRAIKVVTDQPLYDDNGHSTVKMFGNHINLNDNEIISGDKFENLFVATFHGDGETDGYIGGKIAVYKEKDRYFVGAYIRNITDTPIPEYDDANTAYPIVDVADDYQKEYTDLWNTTYMRGVEVPSVDRFFGYKDFEIYLTDTDGIGYTWIEKAEVKYAEKETHGNESYIYYYDVPKEAISIEVDDNFGCATLSFKSDFYDNALVILTDTNGKQHCFSINRTGIVISGEMTGGDNKKSLPVRHGHIDSTEMRMPDGSDFGYGIYATYYYPDKGQAEADADLFVTLTYSDNSCEYKLISSDHFKPVYTDEHGTEFAAASDYFIYMGSADHLEVPVKVEAIAVPKADANGRINGAKFGSGSGVLKNIEIKY